MTTIKLTRELIHTAGSCGNGFNKAQLDLLGVNWPPQKGWLSWLVGQEIPLETWNKVTALKGVRKARRELVKNPYRLPNFEC